MSSYQRHPRSWWVTETEFIERESIKDNPMGSFLSYCDMQSRFAKKDGFLDLADRINNAKKRRG